MYIYVCVGGGMLNHHILKLPALTWRMECCKFQYLTKLCVIWTHSKHTDQGERTSSGYFKGGCRSRVPLQATHIQPPRSAKLNSCKMHERLTNDQ